MTVARSKRDARKSTLLVLGTWAHKDTHGMIRSTGRVRLDPPIPFNDDDPIAGMATAWVDLGRNNVEL